MLTPTRRSERFRRRLLGYLRAAFGERMRRSGIADVDALSAFLRTRSAYIAQTALYGYLKTRMGTSFRRHFEDEGFADVIHGSTVKLYASCLSDLTVFAAATVARDAALADNEPAALARHCFREAFHAGLAEVAARHLPEGAAEGFDARLGLTDWAAAAVRENAFRGQRRRPAALCPRGRRIQAGGRGDRAQLDPLPLARRPRAAAPPRRCRRRRRGLAANREPRTVGARRRALRAPPRCAPLGHPGRVLEPRGSDGDQHVKRRCP